jgi:hypothetical protein
VNQDFEYKRWVRLLDGGGAGKALDEESGWEKIGGNSACGGFGRSVMAEIVMRAGSAQERTTPN